MPAVRALFLDIDGTLLDSHQRITPAVRSALLAFQKAGGVVVLSSARPYAGMQQYGEELCLAQYGGFYAAFNGGQLVDAATLEETNAQPFSAQDAGAVVAAAEAIERTAQQDALAGLPAGPLTVEAAWAVHDLMVGHSLNLMTYRKDTLIMKRLEAYAAAEALVNHLKPSLRPDFPAALDFAPVKFLISGAPGFLRQVLPDFQARLPHLEIVLSDPFFIEVTPPGIHKGRALEAIAARLHISLAETAAIGDSANDLPMLTRAGVGVAMGNAPEAVKQAADVITKTNDEDGVAYFLSSLS